MKQAVLLAKLAAIATFGVIAAVASITSTQHRGGVMDIREHAKGSPAWALAEHPDCWTGSAPLDVRIPGHVIWQHPDGRTVYSARLTGPALETLFGDGDLPGRAIAFCR